MQTCSLARFIFLVFKVGQGRGSECCLLGSDGRIVIKLLIVR